MDMQKNTDTTEKKAPQRGEEQPQRLGGERRPAMVDTPVPAAAPSNPTRKPSETPREPNEIPEAAPREVPRQPLPTERDRERAENEGMIAP